MKAFVIKSTIFLSLAILIYSCKKDDVTPPVSTPPEVSMELVNGQKFSILQGDTIMFKSNSISNVKGTTLSWQLNGKEVSKETYYKFASAETGDYSLKLIATNIAGNDTVAVTIKVYIPVKQAKAFEKIILDPESRYGSMATYLWKVDSQPERVYSISDTTAEKPVFYSYTPGTYSFTVTTTVLGKSFTRNILVTVSKADKEPSPYIAKVFDYMPAPGQFVNKLPEYEDGDTQDTMNKKVEESIAGQKNGALISLGGFGGYVVFGFDHTIVNVAGMRDIRVMGNAFYAAANPKPNAPKGGSCEPGVIMVAYDANGNGKPDDNEWYEIAGSEYNNPKVFKGYQITYTKPAIEEGEDDLGNYVSIRNYIKWTDNNGGSGYKVKNSFHDQSYFPMWIKSETLTLNGTLLPNNAVDESGSGTYWVLYAYGFGYADNGLNNEDDSAFDIGWAVDSKGSKVNLPGVDFVKVYTGTNQEAGWLGEVSTEIAGAYDLHLAGEKIPSVKK